MECRYCGAKMIVVNFEPYSGVTTHECLACRKRYIVDKLKLPKTRFVRKGQK